MKKTSCRSPYIWLLLLHFFTFQEIFGQHKSYQQGQVVDQSGHQPVPFAHIRIKNQPGGTVTNTDGKFKLYYDASQKPIMIVSAIGYKTVELRLPVPEQNLPIALSEDVATLSEVIVVAADEGRKLVQKAFENIEKNYPNKPQRLHGFIREVLSKDAAKEIPYYVSEAEVSVSKAPYTRKSTDGEVQLIRGRKVVTPHKDSLGMSIYAGAHLPHRFDVVSRYEPPIHPNQHKNFFFDITDTLKYEGKYLFEVSFSSLKNEDFKGNLYILDSSFAIVKADYFYEKEALNGFREWISGNQRQYLYYTTEYLPYQNYWQLSSINYRTAFLKNNDRWVYLNSRYVTHGSTPEEEKIPYPDQIQFRDYLLESVENLEENYWEDRNIHLADDVTQNYFEQLNPLAKPPNENNKVEKAFNTINRFVFEYQWVGFQQSITDFSINFQQQDFQYLHTVPDHTSFTHGFSTIFNFMITKHWYVGLQSISSFARHRHNENIFMTNLRFNLRPKKRPLYLNPSLGYSTQTINFGRERISLSEPLRLGGRNFHSGEANVFAGIQRTSIQPGLSFQYEQNRRISWVAGAKYDLPLDTRYGINIYQRRNIFNMQRTFIPMSDQNLTTSGTPSYARNLLLHFGLELRF